MFEIGNSLREARLRQGLELPDVERVTKIRPKYLRALEDEQFEILPAQTYAEFLGLDGQLYVDEYNSRYVPREEDVPFRPRRSNAGRRRNARLQSGIVLAALVGISIVFALVIAAWNSGDGERTLAPLGEPQLRTPTEQFLVVRPVRGATRIQVRKGSRFGEQVFAGTLETVKRFELRGPLWMEIARPRNVDLVVGGRTVAAPDRFVRVTRNRVTPAG